MATRLEGTESAAKAIARVKYTHDALIDLIMANPELSQGDLAKLFGYTEGWISRVMNSDAFLNRMAERKTELIDPTIRLSFEEKLKALADKSIDIVHEKLATVKSVDLAMKALELSTKALGFGARSAHVAVQQNFVVALPPKAASAAEWAAAHGPQPIDVTPQPEETA